MRFAGGRWLLAVTLLAALLAVLVGGCGKTDGKGAAAGAGTLPALERVGGGALRAPVALAVPAAPAAPVTTEPAGGLVQRAPETALLAADALPGYSFFDLNGSNIGVGIDLYFASHDAIIPGVTPAGRALNLDGRIGYNLHFMYVFWHHQRLPFTVGGQFSIGIVEWGLETSTANLVTQYPIRLNAVLNYEMTKKVALDFRFYAFAGPSFLYHDVGSTLVGAGYTSVDGVFGFQAGFGAAAYMGKGFELSFDMAYQSANTAGAWTGPVRTTELDLDALILSIGLNWRF